MSDLIIVESPAKAKTIEKFLGKKYTVKASVGHIRDLPKSKLGIDIENNYEPKYIQIRGKAKIANELKAAAKKADKVYLATDPDREGEAISWHLAYILGLDETEKNRIEFNEITKQAVKDAIKKPRTIDRNLVDAQQARRILDRLVGYKISPILWSKIRKGLSAGRVQSVATKIIVDREREIQKFVPEEYWDIKVNGQKENNEKIEFAVTEKNNKKLELKNQQETDEVVSQIKGKKMKVEDIEIKSRKRAAFRPFTTSTLQQEAANKLGFSTKKTMSLAQQLYEGINIKGKGVTGLITYMRTDSTRISAEAQDKAKDIILEKYGKEYYKKYYTQTKKSSNIQDAHECIRPAYLDSEPIMIEDSLTTDQYKLYRLIYKRFISCMMKDAVYEGRTIKAKVEDFTLKATGSVIKFPGFLKEYDYVSSDDNLLPEVEKGEELIIKKIIPAQHFTQPPARYNEASLVKTLEEKGIGRPSTYSSIITTIQDRNYVEKKQKSLYPTELGFVVNELLENYFSQIVDIKFTADIESQLDTIEEGQKKWQSVVDKYYSPLEEKIKHAQENIKKVDMDEETDEICDKCGGPMVIKYGRYGKFIACKNYPECKNTKAIQKKLGVKCPVCKDGDVVIKKTKKGRNFYGCSNYPKCDFVTWNMPTGEMCPQCKEGFLVYASAKSKKIKCSNKECKYTK